MGLYHRRLTLQSVDVPRPRLGTVDGGIALLAFLGFFLDRRVSICKVSILKNDIGAEDGR